MESVCLLLHIDPSTLSTAQQKGERVEGGFVRHFIKPQVRKSQERIYDALIEAWTKAGREVFIGKTEKGRYRTMCRTPFTPKQPLELEIAYFFPYRSGTPKSITSRGVMVPMVERPDCDNLTKGLQDVLVDAGIIPDDAQVSKLAVEKIRWCEQYISVKLRERVLG